MKEYMLFGWKDYYPNGGFDDFIKSFDTLCQAEYFVKEKINSEDDRMSKYECIHRDTFDKVGYWFVPYEI